MISPTASLSRPTVQRTTCSQVLLPSPEIKSTTVKKEVFLVCMKKLSSVTLSNEVNIFFEAKEAVHSTFLDQVNNETDRYIFKSLIDFYFEALDKLAESRCIDLEKAKFSMKYSPKGNLELQKFHYDGFNDFSPKELLGKHKVFFIIGEAPTEYVSKNVHLSIPTGPWEKQFGKACIANFEKRFRHLKEPHIRKYPQGAFVFAPKHIIHRRPQTQGPRLVFICELS